MALVFSLFYDDLGSYLEGQIVRNPADTGWRYMIEAAQYFKPPELPDEAALLAGLHDQRVEAQIVRRTYRDFAFWIDPIVAFIKSIGRWTTAHPWISLFIPASQTATFIGDFVATLTPDDLGVLVPGVIGPALLYPFKTNLTQQRLLFRVPDESSAFHLSLLRFPDPAQASRAKRPVKAHAPNRRMRLNKQITKSGRPQTFKLSSPSSGGVIRRRAGRMKRPGDTLFLPRQICEAPSSRAHTSKVPLSRERTSRAPISKERT
ncbi:MAG: hypothetical protein ACXWUQ_17645 [Allosphingosinicella sp.]